MRLIGDGVEGGVVCMHVGRRWGGGGEIAHMPRHWSRLVSAESRERETRIPCADGVAEADGYAANSLWAS